MKENMMGMMYEAPAFKESEPDIEYNPIPMIDQSPTLGRLFAALATAQGQMKPARMDSNNPHFGHPYASLDSILESVRKPLSDNELAVVQRTRQNGDGILMETTLGHSSGEWIRSTLKLVLAAVGRPTDAVTMQSLGSAITYARRYGLAAITGAVSDADDDGNAASAPKASAPKKEPATKPTVSDRHPDSAHICPIHKVPFKVFDRDGENWYSHKVDGKWCNEKAAQAQAPAHPQTPAQPQGAAQAPTAGEAPVEPGQAALDEAFGQAEVPAASTARPEKPVSGEELNAECEALLKLREKAGLTPERFQEYCLKAFGERDLWKLTANRRGIVRRKLESTIRIRAAETTEQPPKIEA